MKFIQFLCGLSLLATSFQLFASKDDMSQLELKTAQGTPVSSLLLNAKADLDISGHTANGALNLKRGLYQFTNEKGEQPKRGDILVLKPTILNRFGHVSIVASFDAKLGKVEVIQQNPGPFSGSRETYSLSASVTGSILRFDNDRVLGWLRK